MHVTREVNSYLPPNETEDVKSYLPLNETKEVKSYLPPNETEDVKSYLPPNENRRVVAIRPSQTRGEIIPPQETYSFPQTAPPPEPDTISPLAQAILTILAIGAVVAAGYMVLSNLGESGAFASHTFSVIAGASTAVIAGGIVFAIYRYRKTGNLNELLATIALLVVATGSLIIVGNGSNYWSSINFSAAVSPGLAIPLTVLVAAFAWYKSATAVTDEDEPGIPPTDSSGSEDAAPSAAVTASVKDRKQAATPQPTSVITPKSEDPKDSTNLAIDPSPKLSISIYPSQKPISTTENQDHASLSKPSDNLILRSASIAVAHEETSTSSASATIAVTPTTSTESTPSNSATTTVTTTAQPTPLSEPVVTQTESTQSS